MFATANGETVSFWRVTLVAAWTDSLTPCAGLLLVPTSTPGVLVISRPRQLIVPFEAMADEDVTSGAWTASTQARPSRRPAYSD